MVIGLGPNPISMLVMVEFWRPRPLINEIGGLLFTM